MKTQKSRRPIRESRSRFAPFASLLLNLYEKYPSRSGKNIDFRRAFKDNPDSYEELKGEPISALRSHVTDLVRRHRRAGEIQSTGFEASHDLVAATNGKPLRKSSRFAAHDQLLREIFKRFPSRSGKSISFPDAFEADPSLRKKLGIKNKRDLHSCQQHALKLLTGWKPPKRQPRQKRQKAEAIEELALAKEQEPPPTANFCWNCGAIQQPVNQALALMTKLRQPR